MYKIPLTPYSKIFYNEWKLDQNRSDYNIVFDQNLSGLLEIQRLNDAIKRFISDYIIFNSHIDNKDKDLYWVENDTIHEIDFFEKKIPNSKILSYIQKPFDLETGPLYRFGLVKVNNNNYRLIIVLHHIVIDGQTMDYFIQELSNYYNNKFCKSDASKEEQLSKITKLSIELSEYVYLNKEKSKSFWKEKLKGIEPIDLRFLKLNKNKILNDNLEIQSLSEVGEIRFSFDKEIFFKLNKLKKKYEVTPYLYGKSIIAILLNKYSGKNSFCISYPIAINEGANFIHGAHINTIMIPYDFSTISTISDIFNQTKKFIKALRPNGINHSYLPIFNIISALNKDVLNISFSQTNLKDKTLEFVNVESKVNYSTNIDLVNDVLFEQEVRNEEINYRIKYKLDRIEISLLKEFIESYKRLFTEILEELINIKNIKNLNYIKGYNLLSNEQYTQIVYTWNDTGKEYPCDKTIHGLFEEQVERSPDSIALVCEGIHLSYREVNERANKLAHYIRSREEIESDTLIALCLDRSEHMLISILAVLKAGGAYVPMDPGYPDSRIEYIVNDTRAKVLLTNIIYQERIDGIDKGANTSVIAVDSAEVQEALVTASIFSPVTRTESTNLAYVIYTSGTTGNPKGVMIGHRGVVNTIASLNDVYDLKKGNKITAFTSYIFDVSVSEFFTALFRCGEIHLLNDAIRSDSYLISSYVRKNNINYVYLPPILLSNLPKVKYKALCGIIYAGEPCDINTGEYWSNHYKLYNYYGPTEVTIYASGKKIKNGDTNLIGKPISNTNVYILDNNLTPLPIGAIGELYVGGVGLARGYLNRVDLTAEKFIANPFRTEEELRQGKNARLYRTGDLARLLPDGNLEYIGRNDSQVKIRGYRIELGEIESALLSYEDIKQSVVVTREYVSADDSTGNKYLVGYYVSEHKLKESDILTYLESKLPEYMVPSTLVHLEKLPLTINGKLDRKALPDTEFTDKDNYLAPRNELEAKVCQIWAEVLGIEVDKVGIHDNFFRLGGNSILAIRLVSKLGKELNINVSIASIFKSHSIERLIEYLKGNAESGTNISKVSISNAEKQKLSFAQERLWFIEKYEEGTNAYNIPMLYKLSADINLDTLEMSLKAVVARHEILRTLIKENTEGLGYQLVLDNTKDLLEINKISITSKIELETELQKAVNYVYDLSNEIPIRVCFYYLQPNKEYYTSIVVHHIAFDGWSTNIFFNELQEYYNYYLAKLKGLEAKLNLPDITIQYRDFALWQRNYLSGDRLDSQLNYWRSKLENYETLNLVTDKQRLKQVNYSGKNIYFEIDKGVSISLRELAKELKVSLYSVLLSAYYLMLRVYSNQDDIVIGTAVSNRHYNQVESLIGFFVNTIVLRTQIRSTSTIKEFIETVSKEVIEAQLHQDLPFEKLVEELQVEKDTSRHPIFQVMFGLQNFGFNTKSELLQGYVSDTNLYNVAKFDIETFIDDSQEILRGGFNYAVSLYTEETINRLKDTYLEIVKQISNCQVEEKISDIGYLNKEEYKRIVYGWNDTGKEYPCDKTIHGLFEEQVERSPDSIALVYEDIHLSYREVNERANKLAHYIRSREEIEPDTLIALCLDRSEHMLISILAVLKAGGAYVPMDTGYPDSRIEYIVNDTRTKVLLTNSVYQERLDAIDKGANTNVIAVDSAEVQEALVTASIFSPVTRTESTNLAYVIYTSGTTGNPKGVLQLHSNIIRLLTATHEWYKFNHNDVWTLFHSYIFDFSVWEIWGAFNYGGKLIILSNEKSRDLNIFYELCQQQKVTVLNHTPTAFYQFADIVISNNKLTSFRYIIFGGETLNLEQLKGWFEYYSDNTQKLINMYGITETTVHVTYKQLKENGINNNSDIGKLIPDLKAYVLDNNLTPLPIGAIGELYVGGVGLARGYLNRADLTAEKFIANPFRTEEELRQGKNARLYRTGDLARLLPDGNLEYIGRNDFQVKIRGYRIELGEIESALLLYEGIKQSVVVAREHVSADDSTGNKYLVGYYVSDHKLKESDILTYLGFKLPEYMVPSTLVHLEKLPLTINGKLDRKALPDPEFTDKDNYLAPRNELEAKMCQIWSEVLGIEVERVGIRDDFFRLGGDSILAIRLVSKVNIEFKSGVKVRDIFKLKCISNLAETIFTTNNDGQAISYVPFNLVNIEDYKDIISNFELIEDVYPASYLQIGMLLESNMDDKSTYHNISNYLISTKYDEYKFLSIWKSLVDKHELLRAAFVLNDNGWNVIIHKDSKLDYQLYKNRNIVDIVTQEKRNSFDYNKPGLFRLIVNDLGNSFDFIHSFHHVIEDGWSVASLINEFIQTYVNDKPIIPIPDLRYGEFVQNEILAIEDQGNATFWKEYLDNYNVTKVNWKFDKLTSEDSLYNKSINLSTEQVTLIHRLAKDLVISIDSIFLLAYLETLSFFTNNTDMIVGQVVNNRLEKEGGDKLFGLFLNTIPFRFNINNTSNYSSKLLEVFATKVRLQQYKHLPYGYIKSLFKQELYDFAFNFIHFHIFNDSYSNLQSLGGYERTNIPFVLSVSQYKESMFLVKFSVHDNYISQDFLDYFTVYYQESLLNILNNPGGTKLRLTEQDYKQIVYDWNNTGKEYPCDKTIHGLFEEQVEKSPDSIALVYEDIHLSYREVNERANKLAHYIRSREEIEPDTLIALCLDRSEHMLISILAVLKAGGAYVPMDPGYPDSRIEYIVNDTRAKVLLTNSVYQERLDGIDKGANTNVIAVDSAEVQEALVTASIFSPVTRIESMNLAYVIYTSGTTGNPKGVMIGHRGVVSLVKNSEYVNIDSDDSLIQFADMAFDATTFEIWGSLLNGAKLFIPSNKVGLVTDINLFYKTLITNKVSILWLTKTLFDQLFLINESIFKNINYLLIGGESLNKGLISRLIDSNNVPQNIINGYGPTENTTFSCTLNINKDNIKVTDSIPIGIPLVNRKAYILNSNLTPLPIGAIGELHVGGVGLARGYLNRADLTAEKFIANPFRTEEELRQGKNARLYRTGDLARLLPDGNLEYIGRNDSQVKIRGYRIELGEIESALLSYEDIKQSVVVTREYVSADDSTGNKYLVGYYVSEHKLKESDILTYLESKLPEYMVPSTLVHLEKLPLTINGKLDRKALPDTEFTDKDNYLAPRNELEKQIIHIWSEVLKLPIEIIGINQSFFKLGGNSILIIKLKSRLVRIQLLKDITVTDLFRYYTIQKLVEHFIVKEVQDEFKLLNPKLTSEIDIAILSLSGAFSGNDNVSNYWNMIKNGLEGIQKYNMEECRNLGVAEDNLINPNFIPVSGHVPNIDLFDPLFWNLSGIEAKLTDPQIRKFLEHCWYSLELAGYITKRKELNIGVFAGSGHSDYFYNNVINSDDRDSINMWEASTMNNKDALTTKISYLLGLTGPANNINTSCSTSLVTVVEACKNLSFGICDMALAGGVSFLLPNQVGYIYQEGMIASKDGHCRPFDNEASGTISGSGVGVVLLKRLSDAIKDGDRILAVIKGYATNNDGDRKINYTSPSIIGQAECIINAQRMAGLLSDSLDYIETHGTGTNIGDPIEIQALNQAFHYNKSNEERLTKCILGAVKANIGHCNSAAGIAGLIKICKMLEDRIIPKQINYVHANQELSLDKTNFDIITANRKWLPRDDKPRIAGVSSFGIGGTNAHVIISEFISDTSLQNKAQLNNNDYNIIVNNPLVYTLPITAKTKKSLIEYKKEFIKYLKDTNDDISDIAYTLEQRREHFNYRYVISCNSLPNAIKKLESNDEIIKVSDKIISQNLKNIFMFPGQGSQYIDMGFELYQNDEDFKSIIDNCIEIIKKQSDIDIGLILFPRLYGKVEEDINLTKWTQPSLFIISYALARLLNKIGITAEAYIGHSIGEYVAATLSGVFSLESALKLVMARGRLMQEMPAGKMLSIQASVDEIAKYVEQNNCEVAVINSNTNCVVSGLELDINKLKAKLNKLSITSLILNTSHAYHSCTMEEAAKRFIKEFDRVTINKPKTKFISNVTGEFIQDKEAISPLYWANQIRKQVQFAKGVDTIFNYYNGDVVFIESGPGRSLNSFVQQYKEVRSNEIISIQLMRSLKEQGSKQNIKNKKDILSILWFNGFAVNLNKYTSPQVVLLPTYQFDYKSYWIKESRINNFKHNKLNPLNDMFYAREWKRIGKLMISNNYRNLAKKNILIFNNENNSDYIDQLVFKISLITKNFKYIKNSLGEYIEDGNSVSLNLSNQLHINKLKKLMNDQFDTTIYFSSGIRDNAINSDISAAYYLNTAIYKNLTEVHQFISISCNNYDVLGDETLAQFPSVVPGITKSLPIENSNLNATHYDINFESDVEEILKFLASIIDNKYESNLVVVRNKYLWVPIYKKISLNTIIHKPLVKDGDSILISGGLGGIGYSLAQYINTIANDLNIILIGRTDQLTLSRKYRTNLTMLKDIRKNNIFYISCDIGNLDSCNLLINKLQQLNIAKLNLVIHAAGIGAKSAIEVKEISDIYAVTDPKIQGMINIIKISKQLSLGTIITCSSLSTIVPSYGNMEYTAANLFLDEISYRKYLNIDKIITVNFNQISDVGMAFEFISKNKNNPSLNSICSSDIPNIIDIINNTKNLNHIILSKYDIEKQLLDIEEQLLINKYTCNLVKEDNQAIIIVEKNFTELEYKLAQIFCTTLCLDEISLHDDFFRLGGNSILAIRLVNKINRALNSNINISSIFKYNTVERLAHYLERSNKDNVLIEKIIVTRVEEQKLSFAQDRLWFIEKYEEGTNAYNIPMLYKLSADINLDTLEMSLKAVVARHEILRTLIKENTDGLGYQLVLDNTKNLLEINKISITNKIELETELQKAVNYVYDLSNEIPIRVCFYYLQPGKEYYISIVVHHIAFDGWSTNIFFNELQEYYNYYLAKLKGFEAKLNLPDITIQYRDFALWQRNYLSGDRLDGQLNYWRNKLENYETLNLVTDKQRLKQVNYSGKNIYFEIGKGVSISLRELAKELKVSLYSVLLSAYYLMLRVYSNQDDIVIGTAVSNRHYNQVESLIGFFVNTIVLRTQIRSTSTIKEFIETVSKEVIEAQLHQDLPFEKLVEELQVEKDTSRHPIFQVMFGLQNFGFNTKSELLQGYVSDTNLYNVAKFDIETFIDDSQEILRGGFNYAVSLYTEETINRLKDTYLEIVKQISNCQVEEKISDIGYLNKEEYERIVYGWNDTGKEYPCDKTIHRLFEEQVERNPDSIALVYEDIHLSYREVNERANKLAHYIRSREEIEPDTLIALCLDRSEHMLISILAVLEAGGAYVPMDPGYPDSRIEYIVNDTRAKVLLTNSVYQERLDGIDKGANTNVIAVDSAEVQEALVTASIFSPVTRIESMNLAYVIYTSGTTGNPKGVMIGHRGVVSLVKNSEYVNIDSDDSLIQFADMAFDATTFEIWGSLLNGAKLFIPSNKVGLVTDINLFYKTLITNKVSILWLTKTLFDQLFLINESIFKNINYLLIGGESLNKGLISRLIDSNNVPQNIINGYGPTENTTFSCTLNINKDNIKVTDSIPIGIPLVNRKAYILNSNLTPLPIGAIGELHVGGVGLARGYLNRADLTAEKFIANPFRTEEELRQGKNARLYRTGDLARLLPDGNLEYIGRNDSQVKIRGYRIELGEIESALLSYEDIKQSVVVTREYVSADDSTGNKYLVGYYVSEHKLKESDILTYLESKLPEYMVPSTLVHLEKLPLTINGKLDRKALPDTEFTDKDNYLAPRNELEVKVCQIWAEVLGIEVDKVGIHDNFFRLGGNSILAIRLVSKLGKELNINVSIASIFKSHSIERLIEYLKGNAESGTNISKVSISNAEKQKLSFAQERLWFIEKYEEGTNAYNIPMLYKLYADINLDTLEMSLKAVVARHEILRTLIKENTEGLGYQLVLDNTKDLLEINKISITSKIELETELQKAVNYVYDLSNEIPIRVCFYYLQPDKEYYTSIVVHHIAFDGWSTNIFFNELQEYYNYYLAKLKGLETKLNLPDITIQYRDFALWQRNYLSGDRLDDQLNYWRSKLENYETLNLVIDKQRLKQVNYSGKNIYFEIDKGVSISLRELAKELKVSLYSVLLSAYYLMLRVYSNQDDIVIGTAVSNRHYNQVESLIGFFVNTIVLRTQIRSTSTIKEFIETVSKEVIEAQLHQDLPFEKLVEELQVEKDTSRHPIFQVMFGLQNFGFNTKSELLQGYVSDTNLYNVAKFDIETFIDDSQEILRGGFNYAVSLYTEETINRLKDTYLEIVKQISNCQVEEKISDIGYLNKEEYERIVYGWNDTGKEYPCDKTIHRLFEEQVEKSPDSIALVYEDIHLSYREVNERANKLAHYIRSREEIEPDTLIALCLDRSEHMLISILAVLKAGGAYVPMDPGYPDSRIEYIVNDTRAKVLLTNSVYQERLDGIDKGANTNVIAVDSAEVQEALVTASIFSPVTRTESTNLAYVIYTSGTTGNPKGVMIGHRGVVNTIASLNDVYDLKKGNKITAFTSYIFDVSVSEFFTALFRCGEIHLLNDAIRSDSYLISSYVRKNNINYVYLPPILLSNLPKVKYKALCGIIYAGEPCDINTGEYWSNHYKLYNYYGPTEVTIYASGKKIKNGDTNLIGKPISNTNVYILDNNLTPLPIGAIGELHVGGVGLARGYLNRADLTAEKFIANPFRTEEELGQGKNARLYRTGDLARLLPDGNLEYIGRNDSQVKIRGYRIELGEIESALLSYEDIKQSVVVTREYVSADDSTGNKYLVGYYVSEHKLKESDILTYLESKLPEYMVPNILVHLEKLPLTVNGKLDKQALPYPEFGIDIDSYVAPRNELESKVCSIWGEILNLSSDKIGIHDNFFKLGGNSFTTVKLITKINKNFGTSILIQDIFLYPTISQIAKVIESTEASNLM